MTSKKPIKLKASAKPKIQTKPKPSAKSKTPRQKPTRRTTPESYPPFVSATLHERIAARAFENYERRIRQGPLDDWLQAEQEILGRQ